MSNEGPKNRAYDPENYQSDEQQWELIQAHENDGKELQERYATQKATNEKARESIARERASLDALEEEYERRYSSDPDMLAYARERIKAYRDYDDAWEKACDRLDEMLAELLAYIDELEAARNALITSLRKSAH